MPRAGRQEQAELPAGNGERILLCEDDADVRQFSSETLSELGYDVVEAHDAESALKALATNGPIDLLFTDIVLPGGRTGRRPCAGGAAAQPQLKVLFATGYARSALEERQGPDVGNRAPAQAVRSGARDEAENHPRRLGEASAPAAVERGAPGPTRTDTPVKELDFELSASTIPPQGHAQRC